MIFRPVRTAVVLSLATVLTTMTHSPAAADPEVVLFEGSTTSAQVSVPYPGHSITFDVSARAVSSTPSDLAMLVSGDDGPLAVGPSALELVFTDEAGRELARGTAAELAEVPIDLGVLDQGTRTIAATATLPATVGNEVQDVSMTLTLGLVATQDVPGAAGEQPPSPDPDGGGLAMTGLAGAALVLLSLLLLATGLWLFAARRRREEDA